MNSIEKPSVYADNTFDPLIIMLISGEVAILALVILFLMQKRRE
ncbi:MAG: hypothetical protein ACFFBL_13465 [Promethearchaeota archaeon]